MVIGSLGGSTIAKARPQRAQMRRWASGITRSSSTAPAMCRGRRQARDHIHSRELVTSLTRPNRRTNTPLPR
jgi:hypothetical protein